MAASWVEKREDNARFTGALTPESVDPSNQGAGNLSLTRGLTRSSDSISSSLEPLSFRFPDLEAVGVKLDTPSVKLGLGSALEEIHFDQHLRLGDGCLARVTDLSIARATAKPRKAVVGKRPS
jgi:hypothetical protein